MNTEQIMSQAQVFASGWALVGGRFDNGDMLETANEEKAELQKMIEALVQERDTYQREADRLAADNKVLRDALIHIQQVACSESPELIIASEALTRSKS